MERHTIGKTPLPITRLGFGAFKIGRNVGAKYPSGYALPTDDEVERLLNGVLDLGINYIDTAPAYGTSEERIGKAIGHRSDEFVISTKIGEMFWRGRSVYDFSPEAARRSIERSLSRLCRDRLDLVFIHSDGRDCEIMEATGVVDVLREAKSRGIVASIGLSGKTVEGAAAALEWADAIMVEYHLNDTSHDEVMQRAAEAGVAVIGKKGLASGVLPSGDSIRFVLNHPAVTSLVVGGLNLDHIRENWSVARRARGAIE